MNRVGRIGVVMAGLMAWIGLSSGVLAQDVKPAAPAPDAKPVVAAEVKPVAAAPVAVEAKEKPQFRYGFDLRLREEIHNNFQGVPPYLSTENNYFRIRPRLWAEADLMDNVTLRVRAVDEFRHYITPDFEENYPTVARPYEWPDEVVFDALYLDIVGLMDKKLDLRIGRQDLIYGRGNVILEGTPGDGSRTLYFNAVKASWKGIDKTTVDAFAIYNPGEDQLAMNTQNRNVTSYGSALAPTEVAEYGGGVYAINKSVKDMPVEVYGIYKHEDNYQRKAATNATGSIKPTLGWEALDGKKSSLVDVDACDVDTVGFRVTPAFGDAGANLEAAYQFGSHGDESISAYMVDASLSYASKVDMSPFANAGVYMLSGDNPKTGKDEGWNPLWARYPQNSELYVFWYSGARWSNLIMPKASVGFSPIKQLKTTVSAAYLQAAEANAAGKDERGMLYGAKGEFDLSSAVGLAKDQLKGHVLIELFEPGDYYAKDNQAYFFRWELMYTF